MSPALRCLVLFSACLVACSGSSSPNSAGPTIGKHRSQHSWPVIPLPEAYRGQVPALSNAAALNFLPDTTIFAWITASPASLAKSLDGAAILREYKEFYQEASSQLSLPSGATLLDPASWSHLGIDTSKPAGVAVLMEDRLAAVFFVTLKDKALFDRGLTEFGDKAHLGTLRSAHAGESRVLSFSEGGAGLAIVVRGDVAMVFLPDRNSERETFVGQVAGTSSAPSLASSGRFAKSFADFDHGSDYVGYVEVDTLMA